MTTIKDVARVSNTSVGTVSRYLNGYPIKEENSKRIESAIKELNYIINPIARGLKTNRTLTVGVLIPRLSNTFSTHIIEGMEQTFDESGYSVLVCDSRNSIDKEKEKLRFLKEKLVDGIIMLPVGDESGHILEVQKTGLPMVLIDRLVDGLKCDGVITDNINSAYLATELIIKHGHKKIGIITGPENIFTARERLDGYLTALKDYNLGRDEKLIIHSDYSLKGAILAMNELLDLKEPPTAVLTVNYETTLGAVKAILDRGMVIGKDISLFGYDRTELSHLIIPSLSVVVQPMDAIGRKSAELLIRRMKGDLSDFPLIERLKTEIVVTDSI